MIITLASIAAGALTVAVVLLCWSHCRKPKNGLVPDWPAQVPPYFCEGLDYGREHCSEAGLHQCTTCRNEERLDKIFNRRAE